MWPDEIDAYETVCSLDYRKNIANCKKCVNRSSCGNKNKKEERYCDRYRAEFKHKHKKKKR
jgi:hypothetical protein